MLFRICNKKLSVYANYGYLSSVENDSEAADTAIHICQTEKLSKILHTIFFFNKMHPIIIEISHILKCWLSDCPFSAILFAFFYARE